MLTIQSSTRENPSKVICKCGETVGFVIHHDFIEAHCKCGKQYQIKMNESAWNCCAKPVNT